MIITGQFNDSLEPIMDGVGVCVQNYVQCLNLNHAPSFAIGPKVPHYRDTDAHTLRYKSLSLGLAGPYRLGVPGIDRSFNQLIDQIPFDLVHAHCPFVSGNYALSLSRKRKIPMIATFHSKYRDDFAKWLRVDVTLDKVISMVVRFYEQADSVWVPNEAIIDTLRDYGYSGPIDYVPNGSDLVLDKGEDLPLLKQEGREILKCDPAKPVLLYVGQHRWIKNIRLIIEGLRLLSDKNIEYQMRFVGDGSDLDNIQNLVQKYRLTNHVAFMGPVYERHILKRIYAASDLFVFPSLYDNASLATREAAGLQVPSLFIEGATTANGIQDSINGFLSRNEAPDFAGKIENILSHPELLRTTGEEARISLYKPWDQVVSIVYQKYGEILEKFKYKQLRKIVENYEQSPLPEAPF